MTSNCLSHISILRAQLPKQNILFSKSSIKVRSSLVEILQDFVSKKGSMSIANSAVMQLTQE